jgi:hypothetical protein
VLTLSSGLPPNFPALLVDPHPEAGISMLDCR